MSTEKPSQSQSVLIITAVIVALGGIVGAIINAGGPYIFPVLLATPTPIRTLVLTATPQFTTSPTTRIVTPTSAPSETPTITIGATVMPSFPPITVIAPTATIDPLSRILVLNQVNELLDAHKWQSVIQTIDAYENTHRISNLAATDPENPSEKSVLT